jgi:hypothetical protein
MADRVYCPACGLLLFNGFCLHGRVDEAIERSEDE